MSDLVVGIDIGTTNCKAVVLSVEENRVVATASLAYSLSEDREPDGAGEIAIAPIWQAVVGLFAKMRGNAHVSWPDIRAIGLSGAMHSLIAMPVVQSGELRSDSETHTGGGDGQHRIALRATTWQSLDAVVKVRQLRNQLGEARVRELYARTGCPLQWVYHPARLAALSDREPKVFQEASRFASIKEWITWKLTGRWVIDFGLASTTGLLDIHQLRWDAEALSIAGVEAEYLSQLVEPDAEVGTLLPDVAKLLGFQQSVCVVAGGSDGALANLGVLGDWRARDITTSTSKNAPATTCVRAGVVMTVGTSGAVRVAANSPVTDVKLGHERTWCYYLADDMYVAGGAINNGGIALAWMLERLRENGCADESEIGYEDAAELIDNVPIGADGLRVYPYLTGERSPHWRSDWREVVLGQTESHCAGHLIRATMESVVFAMKENLEAVAGLGPMLLDGCEDVANKKKCDADQVNEATFTIQLTGGITKLPSWCQMLCDAIGCAVVASDRVDASVVGAAMLARRRCVIKSQGCDSEELFRYEVPRCLESEDDRDTTSQSGQIIYQPEAARVSTYRLVYMDWVAKRLLAYSK